MTNSINTHLRLSEKLKQIQNKFSMPWRKYVVKYKALKLHHTFGIEMVMRRTYKIKLDSWSPGGAGKISKIVKIV